MAWYGSTSTAYSQGKSSTNTNSNSTTTSDSTTKQGSLLGGQTIQDLLGTLATNLGYAMNDQTYSKDAAIADSQNAMNAAVDQAIKSGIGGVNQGILNTGAYNQSTRSLLANDLTASAAAAGAQAQQNTIAQYAGINNQNQQTALSALFQTLGLDQSGLSNTKASSETNTKTSSNTKSSNFSMSQTGGWK